MTIESIMMFLMVPFYVSIGILVTYGYRNIQNSIVAKWILIYNIALAKTINEVLDSKLVSYWNFYRMCQPTDNLKFTDKITFRDQCLYDLENYMSNYIVNGYVPKSLLNGRTIVEYADVDVFQKYREYKKAMEPYHMSTDANNVIVEYIIEIKRRECNETCDNHAEEETEVRA